VTSASPAADPSPVIPGKILHFIGGKLVPSVSGATFDVADPTTNRVYAQVAAGDAADVDQAVEAAAEAPRRWAMRRGRRRTSGTSPT
jgi:acyl-CoA reductase-like NAD-dependent aldehyde dehydrogenase